MAKRTGSEGVKSVWRVLNGLMVGRFRGSKVQGYGPQITPLAPLPAYRAYRPVGRSLRLGEQIFADFFK